MAENVTLVTLSQMIDISLNCHEGVINFSALHTLLHVLIQQMDLTDVAIEFRGPDSDRVQCVINTMKPGPPPLLPEYSIKLTKNAKDKTKKKGAKKQISLQDIVKEHHTNEEKKEKELRVIERRKDSKEDPDLHPLPLKSPPGSLLGITPGDLQTVIIIESESQLPQYTVALDKSIIHGMQTDIEGMKAKMNELFDLPTNAGLIEATRSSSGPITDMFHILNLTKRMDATEIALEKVGSLIEDLAKQDISGAFTEKVQEIKEAVDVGSDTRKRSSIGHLDARVTELERAIQGITVGGISSSITDRPSVQSKEPSISKASDKTSVTTDEVASASKVRKSSQKTAETIKLWAPQTLYVPVIQDTELGDIPPSEALILIQEEFKNIKNWVTNSILEVEDIKTLLGSTQAPETNTQVIESRFKECNKQIEQLNTIYTNQIGLLNQQLNNVQQEMNDVAVKLEVVLPGGDSTGINAETTMDLSNKLVLLEKEILAISEKAEKLEEEKEETDRRTEAILEQIDMLKIMKANREDLEDALGDKADACMINRKVSHDQFDAACDDLSKGLEEALAKLEEQEEMWRQALDSIQRDIGNKVDKMDVDPLRDFVNSKIKALQEKFKSLTALRREQEAAGTKSKFLRDVTCISCDKDVVMRKEMDASLKPKAYAMPPGKNMAPYLAYELDQLRKQQKCVPGSKNLNFIESALKTRGTKDKNHICNRYCGGSHTVTTPQQRVTRLGHFLEQWGPEIAPLQEEYIRGIDNQMYRARDESLYKKGGKPESITKGGVSLKVSKGTVPSLTPEDYLPTQDRDTFVSAEVQAALLRTTEQPKGKIHNIGVPGSAREPYASDAKTTQFQEENQD